jgi:Protein of unknown function (DUF1549)/Protein of unknown function (DUF1553)
MMYPARFLIPAFFLALTPCVRAAEFAEVNVDPPRVQLRGPTATYSLLVTGRTADGQFVDLTQRSQYRSLDTKIATITNNMIRPVADGTTAVSVEVDGKRLEIAVKVEEATAARRFNFENDIVTVFSRHGCNSSGCHGKAEGQNGFKLSVFGFDPAADYAALTKEARGRRVFPAAPESSLLLRKMSGQMPHGGGARIQRNSIDYETVRAWIAAGMPFGSADDPTVKSIRVEPPERLLTPRGRQQLRVVATWTDGRETDVTAHAKFQSNNDGLAAVQPNGLVLAGDMPGDAAIMANYLNAVAVFRLVVPRTEKIENYLTIPENNFIDKLVFRKLRKLNIVPSDLATDAEFVRRVYLDVIGLPPTVTETRRFLADRRTDKRIRLVDELLQRPEFADYWALKWADLLRVDRQALGPKRAYAYYKWLRDGFETNKPLDQLAHELLTADGPLADAPAASFYKVVAKPGETASTLSQVFLGVRIACAQCHHHPFDRWSQTDYYGMEAFFNGVAVKPTPRGDALTTDGSGSARHPRTGETVFAHALGEKMPATLPAGDQRLILADWLTKPDNPFFARNLANRVWANFLGSGLVEPVDDVRATNPPTNPELLGALGQHLVESKYDLRALIRVITASRVYQLSSQPNATNERDEQNYSRALFKRPPAEVLLDLVCQTTGVPERFNGMPPSTRAVQLWDSKTTHYFLKVFGRPERVTACECERNREPSVAQVLHLLNSPEIHAKISHDAGFVAKLVKREANHEKLIEELYLNFYSRTPNVKEKQIVLAYLEAHKDNRREAVEDLAWTLMNSLEFVFNH